MKNIFYISILLILINKNIYSSLNKKKPQYKGSEELIKLKKKHDNENILIENRTENKINNKINDIDRELYQEDEYTKLVENIKKKYKKKSIKKKKENYNKLILFTRFYFLNNEINHINKKNSEINLKYNDLKNEYERMKYKDFNEKEADKLDEKIIILLKKYNRNKKYLEHIIFNIINNNNDNNNNSIKINVINGNIDNENKYINIGLNNKIQELVIEFLLSMIFDIDQELFEALKKIKKIKEIDKFCIENNTIFYITNNNIKYLNIIIEIINDIKNKKGEEIDKIITNYIKKLNKEEKKIIMTILIKENIFNNKKNNIIF